MATIPYETFINAARNWDKYHEIYNRDWPIFDPTLNKFLGFNALTASWDNYGRQTVRVPDSSVNKFRWLASPHFRTIIKAYYAQKGEESCIS